MRPGANKRIGKSGEDIFVPRVESSDAERPKKRGRRPSHTEHWTKVTVVLFDRQIVFLDRLGADIRAASGHLIAGMTGQSAIDLFTVQRSEQSLASRRRLNERALEVAGVQNLTDVVVLGTSRRDRGVFMTTIRARHEGREKTLRFAWANNGAVAESDDGALPHVGIFSESPISFALERPLWREEGGTFVFYDIYADQTIRVAFTGETMTVGTTQAKRISTHDRR